MKKLFSIFILSIFLMGFCSALEIETNLNYSLGENFVAKISGNFYTPLTKENIYFFRGDLETSFGVYDLNKIGDEYYVAFGIPTEKIPDNYSIQIANIKYFKGNQLVDDEVKANFTIADRTAFAQISPALSISNVSEFNLTITNLNSGKITISYGFKGNLDKSISLLSGEKKSVQLEVFERGILKEVLFGYENETYSALVYSESANLPLGEDEIVKTDVEDNVEENNSDIKEKNFWEKLFGSDDEENQTTMEKNGSSNSVGLQTCAELGLPICSSNETCDGNLVDGKEAQCCNGTCVEKKDNSSKNKTIGWIIIGAVVLFLAWFFKTKFAKARRS